MRGRLRCSVLFILILSPVVDANAAEIRLAQTPSGKPMAAITIEGEIVAGDYTRFLALGGSYNELRENLT